MDQSSVKDSSIQSDQFEIFYDLYWMLPMSLKENAHQTFEQCVEFSGQVSQIYRSMKLSQLNLLAEGGDFNHDSRDSQEKKAKILPEIKRVVLSAFSALIQSLKVHQGYAEKMGMEEAHVARGSTLLAQLEAYEGCAKQYAGLTVDVGEIQSSSSWQAKKEEIKNSIEASEKWIESVKKIKEAFDQEGKRLLEALEEMFPYLNEGEFKCQCETSIQIFKQTMKQGKCMSKKTHDHARSLCQQRQDALFEDEEALRTLRENLKSKSESMPFSTIHSRKNDEVLFERLEEASAMLERTQVTTEEYQSAIKVEEDLDAACEEVYASYDLALACYMQIFGEKKAEKFDRLRSEAKDSEHPFSKFHEIYGHLDKMIFEIEAFKHDCFLKFCGSLSELTTNQLHENQAMRNLLLKEGVKTPEEWKQIISYKGVMSAIKEATSADKIKALISDLDFLANHKFPEETEKEAQALFECFKDSAAGGNELEQARQLVENSVRAYSLKRDNLGRLGFDLSGIKPDFERAKSIFDCDAFKEYCEDCDLELYQGLKKSASFFELYADPTYQDVKAAEALITQLNQACQKIDQSFRSEWPCHFLLKDDDFFNDIDRESSHLQSVMFGGFTESSLPKVLSYMKGITAKKMVLRQEVEEMLQASAAWVAPYSELKEKSDKVSKILGQEVMTANDWSTISAAFVDMKKEKEAIIHGLVKELEALVALKLPETEKKLSGYLASLRSHTQLGQVMPDAKALIEQCVSTYDLERLQESAAHVYQFKKESFEDAYKTILRFKSDAFFSYCLHSQSSLYNELSQFVLKFDDLSHRTHQDIETAQALLVELKEEFGKIYNLFYETQPYACFMFDEVSNDGVNQRFIEEKPCWEKFSEQDLVCMLTHLKKVNVTKDQWKKQVEADVQRGDVGAEKVRIILNAGGYLSEEDQKTVQRYAKKKNDEEQASGINDDDLSIKHLLTHKPSLTKRFLQSLFLSHYLQISKSLEKLPSFEDVFATESLKKVLTLGGVLIKKSELKDHRLQSLYQAIFVKDHSEKSRFIWRIAMLVLSGISLIGGLLVGFLIFNVMPFWVAMVAPSVIDALSSWGMPLLLALTLSALTKVVVPKGQPSIWILSSVMMFVGALGMGLGFYHNVSITQAFQECFGSCALGITLCVGVLLILVFASFVIQQHVYNHQTKERMIQALSDMTKGRDIHSSAHDFLEANASRPVHESQEEQGEISDEDGALYVILKGLCA